MLTLLHSTLQTYRVEQLKNYLQSKIVCFKYIKVFFLIYVRYITFQKTVAILLLTNLQKYINKQILFFTFI